MRRRTALLPALTVVTAGIWPVLSARAAQAGSPPATQAPAFAVKQLPGDPATTASGEPGIAVNRQGRMIVNTFGPTVWISTDDGATFSNPISPDPTPCNRLSGDADAQVAIDNTFYADNLCLAGGTNLSYSSQDNGATWQGALPGLPSVAGLNSDRGWYAVDPSNAAVVYFSYHDILGPNIWVLKSTDHGHTFQQLAPITLARPTSPTPRWATPPRVRSSTPPTPTR